MKPPPYVGSYGAVNSMARYTRRQALTQTVLGAVGLTIRGGGWLSSLGAAEPPAAPTVSPLNRFPRMVHEYFVERVRAVSEDNLARQAKLRTKTEAQAYVRSVREKIRTVFGPFPEKTPLK